MWQNIAFTWQSNSILFNTTCALNHVAPVRLNFPTSKKPSKSDQVTATISFLTAWIQRRGPSALSGRCSGHARRRSMSQPR